MSKRKEEKAGYGNIYTPHAGSMIIQVQRESGLANRTIVLSPGKVRLLKWLFSRRGAIVAGIFGVSWIFLAVQAARVPLLTRSIERMQYESSRMDTLQIALEELQKRYAQVQTMLSSSGSMPRLTVNALTADTVQATVPALWPLPIQGFLTRGTVSDSRYNGPHPGIDIAVPEGTQIRAAGAGSVVEVGENEDYGRFLRIAHADGYETLYAHASRIFVAKGQKVAAGVAVALSGNTGRSTAPHLHFEVRRAGQAIDPLTLIKQGP